MRIIELKKVMADVSKCQSRSSTSYQPRVKGNFVKKKKKSTASRSKRLKYFNKGNYDLSKSRGTKHSYSREADDNCKTQTTDNDVYYNADIALVERWRKTEIFHGGTAGG